MRTIAVINQKGGCGKTTTSINLAAALAELGRKTLLVDIDPQGHCALGLAVPETQLEASIADALLADRPERFDLNDVLWQISARLDLAPASVSLAAAEMRLANAADRDLRLAKILQTVRDRYDCCIIDCPPAIGLLTFNALRAAGEVIIPVDTGYFALNGSMKQVTTLQAMSDRCGHNPAFHILPNMFDARQRISRQILQEMQSHFGDRVLPVAIHYNAPLREAATFGQPISEYDPASRGAQDFNQLADALLKIHAPNAPAAHHARPADDAPGPAAATATTTAPHPREEPADPPTARQPRPAPQHPAGNGGNGHTRGGTATAAPPAAGTSRVADLLQRARALADRTAEMQQSLARDPDAARYAAEPTVNWQPRGNSEQPTLSRKLDRYYGVRVTSQGALFVQPAPDARQVCVAGDFNEWSPVATPLRYNSQMGVWEACVPLPVGRYRYRLIIDGKWTHDPHNEKVENNPYGGLNSILKVD